MFSKKKIYKKKWNKNLPWVEKYRPMTIHDIVYQKQVISTLKNGIENQNLSHLLFYGPPGTGKTSAILAAAKDLYGIENYKNCVLELNASDERGINVIRTKVKVFSQKSIDKTGLFKLIILDEADSMTVEAQSILRHIIEKYSTTTRFCIICNYIDKIIQPIISRCNKFRFFLLPNESIIKILNYIQKQEKLNYNDEIINCICNKSHGDLRKAITLMQSLYYMYGTESIINSDIINDMIGCIHINTLKEYFEVLKEGDHLKIDAMCNKIINNSYSILIFVNQIYTHMLNNSEYHSILPNISFQILETYGYLIKKADNNLQLLNISYIISDKLCN